MTELEYLRQFSDKARGIAESPIEGDTIEQSARALWEYVSIEAGKHRPWAKTNPWEAESTAGREAEMSSGEKKDTG